MTNNPLATWYRLVEDRDVAGLDALLSDSATFYSPAVEAPLQGREATLRALTAAFRVFFEGSFRYVREMTGNREATLEFQAEVDGTSVNGVDMITWDDTGRIVEFKVMIRPLKAIRVMQQKTAEMLG